MSVAEQQLSGVGWIRVVQDARELSRLAHEGQVDKAGESYWEAHVADVADRVAHLGRAEQAVAWLHDVVEDTEVTLDELTRRGFPPEVVAAVDAITRREGEPSDVYYERVKADPTARLVKVYGDIPSNTDPDRMALLPPDVRARLSGKYAKALAALRVSVA